MTDIMYVHVRRLCVKPSKYQAKKNLRWGSSVCLEIMKRAVTRTNRSEASSFKALATALHSEDACSLDFAPTTKPNGRGKGRGRWVAMPVKGGET